MNQLIWHGPFAGQSGYEVITRNILIAMDKLEVQIALDESPTWNREKITLKQDDKLRLMRMMQTRVHPSAPAIMHQRKQPQVTNRLAPGCKKYIYTLFETDQFPKSWLPEAMEMNGVFTFSRFNKDMWSLNSGIPSEKIHVLPYGIEKEFQLEGLKANILNKKDFIFLINGDFVERKNFEVLLEAYTKEFKPHEKVCLILKTHYGGFTVMHKRALMNKLRQLATIWVSKPPKILFFGDKVTTQDLANLYRAVDCFVLPSRGEGLGLPVLEAMACGLPVIATDWSSLSELNFEGIKLPCTLDIVDNVEFIKKCPEALNHRWANVQVDELRKALRQMYEDKETAKQWGEMNAKKVIGKTWHDAAVKILQVLGGDVK